jgi:putative restriction endonuclease
MRFWWVNHKQTFRHEFKGKYIWSPKRKRDGARNLYYDFLREVIPDDLIFSYASAALQGLGAATSYCYDCPQPQEFGHLGQAWDTIGWRVDVAFSSFTRPVAPKSHLHVLQPIIATESHSPLRITGDGLQHVYLTAISERFAEVLLSLAGLNPSEFTANQIHDSTVSVTDSAPIGHQEWEELEQRRILETIEVETTRHALIRARIGQGLFKERVAQIEKRCRLTFVDNPSHLIGSHIKPWRESSNEERLHGGNGLLLTPTADHLFDRGFITFEDNGEVLISPVADTTSLRRMGLDPQRPPRPLPFNIDQKHFLAHHRKEIFLAAAE